MMKKLKALSFGPDDFDNLDRLCQALGWTASKVVSELLSHAQVINAPAIRVDLPPVATAKEPTDVSA
jgi:hypothetical protein